MHTSFARRGSTGERVDPGDYIRVHRNPDGSFEFYCVGKDEWEDTYKRTEDQKLGATAKEWFARNYAVVKRRGSWVAQWDGGARVSNPGSFKKEAATTTKPQTKANARQQQSTRKGSGASTKSRTDSSFERTRSGNTPTTTSNSSSSAVHVRDTNARSGKKSRQNLPSPPSKLAKKDARDESDDRSAQPPDMPSQPMRLSKSPNSPSSRASGGNGK